MSPKLPPKTTTNHRDPWCLVLRAGNTPGKRVSSRMAYLVGTIAPDGRAIALTGYIADSGMARWTKNARRIEWNDIVKRFRGWRAPSVAEVRRVKSRLPMTPAESEAA